MLSKKQFYAQLANYTAEQITSSYQDWTAFLTTAARLYKYPYHEQLLIFAQRPEATACAEYDLWNDEMGRYVRRGSKGIALLDTSRDRPTLRYVFDISNTGGSARSRPFLWEYRQEHEQTVKAALEAHFNISGKDGFVDQLERTATQLVTEYWADHQRDILDIIDDSFLEGYDDFNIGVAFRSAATVSTTYALLSRCGLEPEVYFEHEDFLNVFDFNTPQTVAALGTAISQTSEQILRQIEIAIKNYEREKIAERSQSHERTDLHPEWGLPDSRPEPDRDRGETSGQVRQDAQAVPQRASASAVEQPAAVGETVSPSEGDRRDSAPASGADDARADEGSQSDGGTESQQPHEMGGPDGEPESPGRGNDSEGTGVQLTISDAPAGEQFSFFPSEAEQIQYIAQAESVIPTPFAFSMPPEDIPAQLPENDHSTVTEAAEPDVSAQFERYLPIVREAIEQDTPYRNACGHSDRENAVIEGNAAIRRAVLNSGDMQLIKLFSDDPDFRTRLCQDVIDATYPRLHELLRPLSQDDIDDALRAWNGSVESKRNVVQYMEQHGRERNTAAWLDREYGGNGGKNLFITRTGSPESIELPWPKVQRRIAQLIQADNFLTEQEKRELSQEAPEATRYRVGAYHHIENGFDDKLDYRTLEEAEKAAQGYVDGTMESDGFQYDGAAVYDQQEQKYLRIYGEYPDPKAHEQVNAVTLEGEAPAEPAPPTVTHDPLAPAYQVGDTVYLDDKPFEITAVDDFRVELRDPTMLYPVFRAENKEEFEQLLQRDLRNGGITEFLPAELANTNADLQDVLTGDGGLLTQRDKDIISQWLRNGDGNTKISQKLSEMYAGTVEAVGLFSGAEADFRASTMGLEIKIEDKFLTEMSFRWYEIAPILRAMYQQERSGFSHEPAAREPVTLEGVPSYKVGDAVVVPYPGRDIKGTIGYISDVDVRVDTGPYSWSNTMVNREMFDEFIRHDERNAHLFVQEVKKPELLSTDQEPSGQPVAVPINGDWQTFPDQAAAEAAAYAEYRANLKQDAQNFHITDANLGVGGPKAKYQANIQAIKLLKYLEETTGQATPEQQEVLSRYVGWGGITEAFEPDKPGWSAEYAELKELLTPEEYAAARASTLNAHYTSPTVIKAIYEAVGKMGFQTGNILEPSMGVGNFFGMLPEEMRSSRLYGVELDSITGRIAKQLYPKADITVAGFETTDRRDFFDLAIGNVPFGQYQVNDPAYNKLGFSIHDYFFAKTLDQVRPGGVIAFVTSRYTMDKQSPEVRKYIAQRAELLGAIRLPNNAFKANAGTDVVSDILFLQKRDRPIDIEPDWVHLGQNEDGFAINSYFIDHPEMILGRQASESTQYGRQDFTVVPIENLDLGDQLHDAVKYIRGTFKEAELPDLGEGETIRETIPADPNVKNHSYTVVDGEVYFRENSVMTKPDLNATARRRVKGMVALRDCVQKLIDQQMDNFATDAAIRQTQAELNALYDSFTAKYGIINSRGNSLAFSDDSSYFLLCSL